MELIATDRQKELEQAFSLVMDWLEEENAHTIGALLEWQYGSNRWNDERMIKAYKSAQWEIFGTQ